MKSLPRFLVFATATALVASCAPAPEATPAGATATMPAGAGVASSAPAPEVMSARATAAVPAGAPIRLTLSASKPTYQVGETVRIAAAVENVTDQPIIYTLWNIGDPAVYVYVDTRYGQRQPIYEEGKKNTNVLPAVTSGTLGPRQSLKRSVVWDQQISLYPDGIQAPAGRYAISAVFHLGAYASEQRPRPITATIEIKVAGAGRLITSQEALQAARALPEVQRWVEAHSGPALVKQEGEQWYAWMPEGWIKTSAEYARELRARKPGSNVLMRAGQWEVRFFDKMGPPPHEISIDVEGATGKVLAVRQGSK